MKKSSAISTRINSSIIESSSLPADIKKVSFSQYSVYKDCPHRWELTYARKLYPFSSSVDTVFGTAFHETIQKYFDLLYNDSIKAANAFDYPEFLLQALKKAYKGEREKNGGKHFITPAQMEEYYEDGIAIMHWISKNRSKLFDNTNLELVGIEIPLATTVNNAIEKIWFQGFLDLVFYNKIYDTYKIIDVKTSRQSWTDYQKKDEKKITQLLLYKKFFSKQFGVPESKIEVEFMICKRKLYENSQFAQPRVQTFKPANGEGKVKEAFDSIVSFIHECFDYDGQVIEREYPKTPGPKLASCKYCPFAGTEYCDQIPS